MSQSLAPHPPRISPVPQGVEVEVFDVVLPPHLAYLGPSVGATLAGRREGSAVVVLGGISGDRFVCQSADGGPGWWPGLVGVGDAIDPRERAILGVDFAADASGRAAPSTQDQAAAVLAAMDAAGVARASIVGASYGGMVALALAVLASDRVDRLVIVSADAAPHPIATAIREIQRRTVAMGLEHGCGEQALAIARGMAMLSYRTAQEFGDRFAGGLDCPEPLGATEPGAYLRACGEAFVKRMSPGRFLSLSASIDRHRVDPARVAAPALLIGTEGDQLVPPSQMRDLAARLGGPSTLHIRQSCWGHDMFLKDAAAIAALAAPFLA